MEAKLKKIREAAKGMLSQDELIMSLYEQLENGKMVRSKLVLSICDTEHSIKLGAIIELIQSASLLHDDVIDDSYTRRGKPSINAVFGNKSAIMLGDVLYSSAFYELTGMSEKIAKSISGSVKRLSLGELQDVGLSKSFNENEDLYLEMIENKSASLIASSSYCASVLSGNDEGVNDKYYDCGLNMGMAFQIMDDILDITRSGEDLGKPNMNDFSQGKTTLPYIHLYRTATGEDKRWIRSCFKRQLSRYEQDELKDMLMQRSVPKAKQDAAKYAKVALDIAISLNNEKLKDVIVSMMERGLSVSGGQFLSQKH